jgi:hypothetical protein
VDEIPLELLTGEVWSRWNTLREAYANRWTFSCDNRQEKEIHLTALLKTLDGKRHVQYESVDSSDFGNPTKVCAKIDALEKKVQDADKMML